MRLRRGEKTAVQVSFLPFSTGHHYARLRFEDNAFGPFVYELHGESTQPAQTGPVRSAVDARQPSLKEVALPFLSPLLEAAKKLYMERHPGSKDKINMELVKSLGVRLEENLYTVEIQSPFVTGPPVVVLQSHADAKARGRHSGVGGNPRQTSAAVKEGKEAGQQAPVVGATTGGTPNVLALTLNPSKGVGVYNARIVLTSDLDVRCAVANCIAPACEGEIHHLRVAQSSLPSAQCHTSDASPLFLFLIASSLSSSLPPPPPPLEPRSTSSAPLGPRSCRTFPCTTAPTAR